MQKHLLNELLSQLELGHLKTDPERVGGGLLHKVWRVQTESGQYAVKQLNPSITTRPKARRDWLVSEKIAAAYARQGISAVPAIMKQGTPLHHCGDDLLMIYLWTVGAPVATGSIDAGRSRIIGSVLAQLHSYQPDVEDLEPPEFAAFGEQHWQDLIEQAREKDTPWISAITEVSQEVITLSADYAEAAELLREELVISHRDTDQKNVLWHNDKEPVIIDWEAAGLTNPALELFEVALYWSDGAKSDAGRQAFRECIRGYRSGCPAPRTPARAALFGVTGNALEWLEFNMRRSANDAIEAEERSLGNREVVSTLEYIRSLNSRAEELIDGFQTAVTFGDGDL